MQTAVIQLHPQRPSRKAAVELISELQSLGLRLDDPAAGAQSRRGGAGPSDHKAVTVDGHTVMIPVHTAGAWSSPYVATQPGADGAARILRDGVEVGVVSFPHQPRFYKMQTFDGIPSVASVTRAAASPASSARSASRWQPDAPSCARRPSNWARWRVRRCCSMASSTWS